MSEDLTSVLQDKEYEMLKIVDKLFRDNGIKYYIACGTALGCKRHGGFIPWDDDVDIYVYGSDYKKIREIFLNCKSLGIQFQDYSTVADYPYVFPKIVASDTILVEESLSHLNYKCGVYIDVFPVFPVSDNPIIRFATELRRYALYVLVRSYYHTFPSVIRKIASYLSRKFINPNIIQKKMEKIYSRYKMKSKYIIDSGVFGNHALLLRESFYEEKRMKFVDIELSVPGDIEEYLQRYYGNYEELPPEDKRISGHHIAKLFIPNVIDYENGK